MLQQPTDDLDLDELRARLRKMSDAELIDWGKSARYMASPQSTWGEVREVFRVQLAEAIAEWRRRTLLPPPPAN